MDWKVDDFYCIDKSCVNAHVINEVLMSQNGEIVPANLFFGDFVSLISLSRWQFESDGVSNQQEIKF